MDKELAKEIREKYLEPLTDNKLLEQRLIPDEGNRDRDDGEFQRDFTRILYSSSFRRLQGKMQLLGIKEDQFFRNRLTHSLEVSQIARSIANQIGYSKEECYIIEAGALAHDIGNPPFGHAGERYLNLLAKDFGGYEGNAQTLRILTTVEQKRSIFQGLNLTYRSLLSIVKYYNTFNPKLEGDDFYKQKFLYKNDYDVGVKSPRLAP
jgi:dGTPase